MVIASVRLNASLLAAAGCALALGVGLGGCVASAGGGDPGSVGDGPDGPNNPAPGAGGGGGSDGSGGVPGEDGDPSLPGDPERPREDDEAFEFVTLDDRLDIILDDLRSFDDSERSDIRYIELYNLANAGYSDAELEQYRDAVSFLMNSLSRGVRVTAPEAVDDQRLLYRIELSEYGWTEDTWAIIANEYPYAVVYDDDSQLFPIDEDKAERIREETGEPVPAIQADWFLSHAVRPPLYYQLLDIPGTLAGLENQLDLSIAENIARARVDRSGFRQASSSQFDRVIERHELSASQGSLWVSYDFADGVGRSDVYAHPLDFEADGMQVMFSLRNGMLAYAVYDAAGGRLDKAPTSVVQDRRSRDGAAEAGISCMSCHQQRGVIERGDEVRKVFEDSGTGGSELAAVLSLYTPKEEMSALFETDVEQYGGSRAVVVAGELGDDAMHDMDDRHLDVLGIREVAAVLGIRIEELERAIDASPQLFPAAVRALRSTDATVPRDGLEAVFPEVVDALRLGRAFDREDFQAP